jgi:hypothetical protein
MAIFDGALTPRDMAARMLPSIAIQKAFMDADEKQGWP